MAASEQLNLAGKVAVWGAESGIIVTMAGVVPVLFLGAYVLEDFAAIALLAAYGLLFGHYLARRLIVAGVAVADHTRLLRAAPPVAMVAGYLGMRLLMGLSEETALSAIDGLVFGGLAGLILGLAVQRLPHVALANAPLPDVVMVPLTFLIAGALMGVVAGFALSIPLGWTAAIPIWQAGIGAVTGFFLAKSTEPT
jgi:hypothetical protein